MRKYDFLSTLNVPQLQALKEVCKDEEMLLEINKILDKPDYSIYRSDRTIYINELEEYKRRYEEIANNLKLENLKFLTELVFKGPGNNCWYGGSSFINRYYVNNPDLDLARLVYSDEKVKKVADSYGVSCARAFHNTFGHEESKTDYQEFNTQIRKINSDQIIKKVADKASKFSYLDEFFDDDMNVARCEGSYNSYMYIKEYIYQMLKNDPNFSVDDLNKGMKEKKELIKSYFKEVCMYLYYMKENIPKARLSAFNNKIIYSAKSKYVVYNEDQNQFIDMLAFGTTLKKIKNKDFEDFHRLIYVPKKYL